MFDINVSRGENEECNDRKSRYFDDAGFCFAAFFPTFRFILAHRPPRINKIPQKQSENRKKSKDFHATIGLKT